MQTHNSSQEINNHAINPRSYEDRYFLLANNIAIQGHDHPAVGPELDLVELEDQLTHQIFSRWILISLRMKTSIKT
ncbi:hypothetical protein L1887_04756 [Cichorium endivia]|nr:hypothetical protein L1887_04756 [Cichorium endivia]